MNYTYELTIPKSTPERTPVTHTIPMAHGVISKVWIGFPFGCAGWVHVSIHYLNQQLWPSNPESWYAWDNGAIEFDEDYELTEYPYEITIKGYSNDDTYPHVVTVSITLIEEKDKHWWERLIPRGGMGTPAPELPDVEEI